MRLKISDLENANQHLQETLSKREMEAAKLQETLQNEISKGRSDVEKGRHTLEMKDFEVQNLIQMLEIQAKVIEKEIKDDDSSLSLANMTKNCSYLIDEEGH